MLFSDMRRMVDEQVHIGSTNMDWTNAIAHIFDIHTKALYDTDL
jgi:hypothetical protein